MEGIVHKAYVTAKNRVHLYWEWLTYDDERTDKSRTIAIQVPVEYIRFDYPNGRSGYMPMSAMLSNGLSGTIFNTATEAIKIEKAIKHNG